MKDLVFKLINENQELRKTITEMIPKVGNNNNSNNTINNKNKFNINVFLNEKCNFKTCNKYNFSKHILSLKHKRQEMDSQKCEKMYYCNCGKKYKYDTGLYKHKKKCQ